MNKNILPLIFIAIFLMGITLATEPSLGTFKQNENVRVTQGCSDATSINLSSISFPNSTIAVSNIIMTSAGNGEYYYNFNDTAYTGRYDVRGVANGCEETFTYYFEVNPSGNTTSSSQGLLSIGIMASVLLLMMFFGWLSFKFIDNDSLFGFGLFFLVLSLILSIYSLFLGYLFARDFLFSSISNVQEGFFLSGLFGLLGIMFIAFTFLIMKVIKELKVKKTAKQMGEGYNQQTKTYDY